MIINLIFESFFDDVKDLLEFFNKHGFLIRNPYTSNITILNFEGIQDVIKYEELISAFKKRKVLNFQLWLSASVDVFICFEKIEDKVMFSFYTDGLELEEIVQLRTAIEQFCIKYHGIITIEDKP